MVHFLYEMCLQGIMLVTAGVEEVCCHLLLKACCRKFVTEPGCILDDFHTKDTSWV